MGDQLPESGDKRRSFRYLVELEALIANERQARCPARLTNISREGLRLEGDRQLVEQVFPNYPEQEGLSQQRLELQLALNEAEPLTDENSIRLICTSVYVLRQVKDRYQIGAYFCEIDEPCRLKLEQLIRQLKSVRTLEQIRDSRHRQHRS